MATRTQQYRTAKNWDIGFETFSKGATAVMSWLPWTKPFAAIPTAVYDVTSPYIYKGISDWTGDTFTSGRRAGTDTSALSTNKDMFRSKAIHSKGGDLLYSGRTEGMSATGVDRTFEFINRQLEIAAMAAGGVDSIKNIVSMAKSGVDAAKAAKMVGEAGDAVSTGGNIISKFFSGYGRDYKAKKEKANIGSSLKMLTGMEDVEDIVDAVGGWLDKRRNKGDLKGVDASSSENGVTTPVVVESSLNGSYWDKNFQHENISPDLYNSRKNYSYGGSGDAIRKANEVAEGIKSAGEAVDKVKKVRWKGKSVPSF